MSIFNSRKVRIAIFDAVMGLIALTVTQFVEAETAGYIMQALTIMQAPIVLVIGGIAYEDAAAIEAGTHPQHKESE